MKKFLLFAGIAVLCLYADAQTINFSNGSVTYCFPAELAGEMPFEGTTVTVTDKVFNLSEWSRIDVNDVEIAPNVVSVKYEGSTVSVTVAGNIAQYIDVDVEGAHVSISQSADVSEATCGEITYSLEGESGDGSLTLTGSYKSSLELHGLTLTNPSGAVLDIQNGKRISISAKNGTENYLTDGKGDQKGAISCKGHLEFKGKGKLTVTGIQSHAVYAKEYVEIKNLTLNIKGAVKDGINCNQYFLMESGSVIISGVGDDGIQTAFKDETDRESEDTGTIFIKGGDMSVVISGDASKCLKADGDINITEGKISLESNSDGIWDSAKNKTKASACLGADGNITLDGGDLELKATGSGGKGISCDGIFTCNGGKVEIVTTGGMLVYANGSLSHNYTGQADRIASDYKSSAKGVKADSGVVINEGEIYVTTSTNNAEGIESKGELDINGGKIFVKAYDDGINSSKDFRISGGDLTVISTVGDGLDSNGNLTVSGGYIRTFGAGGMEMGLDANTETGCTVYLTGGTLLACGGGNTYPNKSGSTQAFVRLSGSVKADTEIAIKSGEDVLASFTVPSEYSSNASNPGAGGPGGWRPGGWGPGGNPGNGSIMISCPELSVGKSYTIVNDSSTSSSTAVLTSSGR